MKRLPWHAQQFARRLGVMGLVGIALLCAAAGLDFGVLHPAMDAARAQQAALARLLRTPRAAPSTSPATTQVLDELPTVGQAPALFKALALVAQQNGINLPQGSFRLSPVADGGLRRLEVRVPVNASYPQLRAFLAASLAAFPSLVLDGFSFKRNNIGATAAAAELHLSFYLRP